MQKYLLLILVAVVFAGFGCAKPSDTPAPSNGGEETSSDVYQNDQYHFNFIHKAGIEARVRSESTRQTDYLGLPVDFFLTIRDKVQDKDVTNLAYVYAAKDLTVDAFVKALEASDTSVKVSSTEEIQINDVVMTKVVSSTAMGLPKTHYLFPAKDADKSTIVMSVFLEQDERFDSVLQTFRMAP